MTLNIHGTCISQYRKGHYDGINVGVDRDISFDGKRATISIGRIVASARKLKKDLMLTNRRAKCASNLFELLEESNMGDVKVN